MRYLEVAVRCRREAADAVSERLSELSGGGYAVEDPLDVIVNLERGNWDITDLVPGDPAWVTVKAWFSEEGDVEQIRYTLEHGLDEIRALDLGTVEAPVYAWVQEEDWANAWKAYFKPTRVGQHFMIVPSWEEYQLQEGDVPLYLDPGMAFGTGTHPTTSLCLRRLEGLIKPGHRVLDVGTGSGILAIGAAKLGASPVVAIDIDPVSIKVAKENAERNGAAIDVRLATLDQVEADEADVVIANIIAAVIIDILPDAATRLKKGGKFLASGIIAEKKQQVLDAMVNTWLLPVEVREENGWVAILATKS